MSAKRRLALPCVLAAVLLVALAIPWAEAQVDAWVDREEAKAAQSWRRTR